MNAPAPVDRSPATVDAKTVVVHELNTYKPVIEKLLAQSDVTAETFVAQIANAMRATPELWKCDPATILGAALRCAQLHLAPNDGTNSAFIIPYGRQAAFQLGYGGVLELARRAEPGIQFEGRPVYPNDLFDLDHGTGRFRHVPYYARRGKAAESRGGDARLWYVKVTFRSGGQHVHVLDRDAVEYHRSFSKQPNGQMWSKSYDAAALKSVVLDMKRWLPHSVTLNTAIAADGTVVDVRTIPADVPELPSPPPPALEAPDVADDPEIDADEAWTQQAMADDD
jgi:recombination protein RecT